MPDERLPDEPAADERVVLDIPATPSLVSTARLVMACLATTRRELSAERVDDLKLAVSEACANAIESYDTGRGGHQAEDRRVSVAWGDDDDALHVWVTDRGRGLDGVGRGAEPAQVLPVASNGLGIGLIAALVDQSVFTSGSLGTTVRMTMDCPRFEPEDY
ncbi:MAG: ATP-binding protein [Acidimicrobiales bacterium]